MAVTMPGWIEPMAATLTQERFTGPDWMFERKLDGVRVSERPLHERQALLAALPMKAPLQRVEVVKGDAPWDYACEHGWEGVIAKRRDGPYEHRRSKHWLKMKCEASQEMVIGAF